jgi:hypothetical protein
LTSNNIYFIVRKAYYKPPYKNEKKTLSEYLELIVLLVDRYVRATILLIPYILINYTLYTMLYAENYPMFVVR